MGQQLESLSDVNTGKPTRIGAIDARVLTTRQRKGLAIELRADAATAALLTASGDNYAPELDKALDWLQRLRPRAALPAQIVLTLVDARHRTQVRRVHDTTAATVVDLVVAMPSEPASPSVEVGKAVAIALHEMSHAFSAADSSGKRLGRRDDEYRAAMVESCYRVDTLRAGDTLRLTPRTGAGANEYFVTAQSRDASRDVVADLIRASGTATVYWYDEVALRGLKLACAVRVAQAP
ncbi:MAG: hypothetical protein ACR2J7_09555 [Luteimonas sp.]